MEYCREIQNLRLMQEEGNTLHAEQLKRLENVKKKMCSHDGCPNQVVKGGVCRRHGAKKAALMDVPIKLSKEEYAEDTVQKNTALMDVPTKSKKEEYAEDMVQCQNNAALMDVPTKSKQEEYAEDTVQWQKNIVNKWQVVEWGVPCCL